MAERGVVAVEGGEHRSESVANALALCAEEFVVVHDAARPLVTPGLIDAMVEELAAEEGAAGVIAATPVTDTIKHVGDEGQVERTLDRSGLWAVQTPQVFRADALREALIRSGLAGGRPATTRCWSSAEGGRVRHPLDVPRQLQGDHAVRPAGRRAAPARAIVGSMNAERERKRVLGDQH